jgi:purine-binding chemotaxis protein CheW
MRTTQEMATTVASSDSARTSEDAKVLTFQVGNEEYGIEILKIREIIGVQAITAVPKMPAFMKGVINLRDAVIPVMDLRLKFGMDELAHTDQTCIIVVDVGKEIGMIVDTVCEVKDIRADNVTPPPTVDARLDASFIHGMARMNDDVIILLDVDEVVSGADGGGVPSTGF